MGDQQTSVALRAGEGLVIELTGARGVGKSTFAASLKHELAARNCRLGGTRPSSLAARSGRSLYGVADQIDALRMIVPWRPESARELYKLIRRYKRVRRDLRFARAVGGVHVFDECVWHLIMTLYIKTHEPDIDTIAEGVRRRVGLPHIVVLVEAADEVIASRRRTRAKRGDLENPLLTGAGRVGLDALRQLLAGHAQRHSDMALVVVKNVDPEVTRAAASRIADLAAATVVGDASGPHAHA